MPTSIKRRRAFIIILLLEVATTTHVLYPALLSYGCVTNLIKYQKDNETNL